MRRHTAEIHRHGGAGIEVDVGLDKRYFERAGAVAGTRRLYERANRGRAVTQHKLALNARVRVTIAPATIMARAMCISNVNGCLDIILYTCPGILYCIHEFYDRVPVFFRQLPELLDAIERIAPGRISMPYDGLEDGRDRAYTHT